MARFEYVMIFQLTIKQIKKDLFKSSTSPGKEAGVLEWVCKFESVTKSKAYGTKKGHNDRYYQNLNSVYCR